MNMQEYSHSINGVDGRMRDRHKFANGLYIHQTWESAWRLYDGGDYRLRVNIRFDDNCKNGHQTFAITADGQRKNGRGSWVDDICGCCHNEIAEVFPELAYLIPYHLESTDGPMHAVANAVYHASNRDVWGKLKGEPKSWRKALSFGDNPIKYGSHKTANFLNWLDTLDNYDSLNIVSIERDNRDNYNFSAKWTFEGFCQKWHECPFDSSNEAHDFLIALQNCNPVFHYIPYSWGEGKERNFEAVRNIFHHVELSDETLSLEKPELTKILQGHVATMINKLKPTMEDIGFEWVELTKE